MTRPLPDVNDPEFAPFWEAASREELVVVHCSACDKPRWPPRPICSWCLSLEYEWRTIPANGRLHTWTVVQHQTTPDIEVPYVIGMVEVHAAPVVRLLGQIVYDRPEELRVDMPLEARFDRVSPSVRLVNWAPTREGLRNGSPIT